MTRGHEERSAAPVSDVNSSASQRLYTTGSWRFAGATVSGTSHQRENLPCQDAHRSELVATPQGDVLIVVVSDGAGSSSEGARGARYICDQLSQLVGQNLRDLLVGNAEEYLRQSVDRTREGLLGEADRLGLPPRQLAATLLCAVLTEEWSAFAQVGDGAIVTPEDGMNAWAWLFWPQRGEYANTTSFLTDSLAMEALEIGALTHPQHELAIFTDGLQHLVLNYEEQTVHSPFFERMMGPVRKSSGHGEDGALSAGLAEYLRSPPVIARADDDLTLVLATRLEG